MNIKTGRRQMITFIFIIAGSLITVVAAFFEYKNNIAEKQQELKIERKRTTEYETIINEQRTVIDTTQKIIELQNELNKKNDEIQKLQNITINNITGGKNIPKLIIAIGGGHFINVRILNDSEFPVRNVNITFSRVIEDMFVGSQSSNPESIKNFSYNLGDISIGGHTLFINDYYINVFDKLSYWYEVRWQNGIYYCSITVANGKKLNEFEIESEVIEVTKGFDLKNAVMVNGTHSRIKK
jgi:cell division protein FtsL